MPRIFLISDNHFTDFDGPGNVIDIFQRQYRNSAEMNADMIRKWNTAVGKDDTIFSIGDFAWKWKELKKYAGLLHGRILFVLGNHDFEGENWHTSFEGKQWETSGAGTIDSLFLYLAILTHNTRSFLLVHRPEDVPKWWKGWVIHGHHHWMLHEHKYPFIDGKSKNINVSCELIDYTPVDLDWILSLDIDAIEWMDTIHSEPDRW